LTGVGSEAAEESVSSSTVQRVEVIPCRLPVNPLGPVLVRIEKRLYWSFTVGWGRLPFPGDDVPPPPLGAAE
jgi:hypothetical protein